MNEQNTGPLWGIRTSGLSMEWVLTSEGLHIQWRNQLDAPLGTIIELDDLRANTVQAA